MLETLKNAFRSKEIRKKILMTLLLLVVFRLGCYIPIPGLARSSFAEAVNSNQFLQLMSGITGSALSNGTLFALGIGPYINASIIVQLLTVGIPALERLSKQGEEGQKKITNITRIITIILAIVQSIGIIVIFGSNMTAVDEGYVGAIKVSLFGSASIGEKGALVLAGIYMTIIYTAGSCLVMWLGERITDFGVGNGISLIIFVGIVSTGGLQILGKLMPAGSGNIAGFANTVWNEPLKCSMELLGFFLISVVLFFLIVFVDLAERKIPVQYAKQVRGTKMYGGQSSVIPMKITGSGVMPLIFAFAIISFPNMIMSIVPAWNNAGVWWSAHFSSGSPWYALVLAVLIFVFAFFYSQIQFNPEDVSKSIQQNGGFIQGIRPGKPTAQYLDRINKRITLFGAIFLTLVAFIPSFVFSFVSADLLNVFSTTGLLIIVSVALEMDKQLQSQIMMKNYKGFLK